MDRSRSGRWRFALQALLCMLVLAGCGQDKPEERGGGHGRRGGGGPARAGRDQGGGAAAVPVEVAPVQRRDISSFIETHGTLEAENEVDLVARTAAPVQELLAEEGDAVAEGQLLARLDEEELRAQLEIARVELDESRRSYDRAEKLHANELISEEEHQSALSRYDAAKASLAATRIQLDFTEIRAPFSGLIVARYVHLAETVSTNSPLFRISDFDPLLCPIQVPERELPRLHIGQRAHLLVEAWPDEKLSARVLRISPVVDAASGTVKVTLEVRPREGLRPGMFARVFVETARRPDALVIPKAALSLDSIGDTVYVAEGEIASRREVRLGFREGDFVEVAEGLAAGEPVVVVGQDGLSDGTPIRVLAAAGAPRADGVDAPAARPGRTGDAAPGRPRGKGRPDFSKMTPEELERAREAMRSRGLSEEQIEQRIQRSKEQAQPSRR